MGCEVEGTDDGNVEGIVLGALGLLLGDRDGEPLGTKVGFSLGLGEGPHDGDVEGNRLGLAEGDVVGEHEGLALGT